MDKFAKLQALTGKEDVYEGASKFDEFKHVKATHIYEGTDSEDDEYITSRKAGKKGWKSIKNAAGKSCVHFDFVGADG